MLSRSLLVLFLVTPVAAQETGAWKVRTDFPGGAGKLKSFDARERMLHIEIPPSPNGGWRTWWYFKVEGITPGESVRFKITGGQAGADRPVYSTDQKTWRFMDAKESQKIDAPHAWFAWYVPYLPEQSERLADWAEKTCPFAKKFELCKSEGGIPVVGIQFSEPGVPESERIAIWIHARQHAWEAGGSWTAHGLVQWLASDDPLAKDLRRRAVIYIVPIIDVDSVFKGLGGKDQKPQDHNRDWTDQPHWNSVKAAMARVQPLVARGRLKLFLDLHDPGWGAGRDLEFWCTGYKTSAELRRKNTDRYLAHVRGELTGSILFQGVINESTPPTAPTSVRWARQQTQDDVIVGTWEIPIAPRPGYKGSPPDLHLKLGEQLGRAMAKTFRNEK